MATSINAAMASLVARTNFRWRDGAVSSECRSKNRSPRRVSWYRRAGPRQMINRRRQARFKTASFCSLLPGTWPTWPCCRREASAPSRFWRSSFLNMLLRLRELRLISPYKQGFGQCSAQRRRQSYPFRLQWNQSWTDAGALAHLSRLTAEMRKDKKVFSAAKSNILRSTMCRLVIALSVFLIGLPLAPDLLAQTPLPPVIVPQV